jgi:hypothetical protein
MRTPIEKEQLLDELAELEGQRNDDSIPQQEPPTRDFLDYPLYRVWQRIPGEKQAFERWAAGPEARKLIAKHDAAVTRGIAKLDRKITDGGYDSGVRDFCRNTRRLWHSWEWQRGEQLGPESWLELLT